MRINKLIAHRLGISRRKADEFIEKGRVLVNNQRAQSGQDIEDPTIILVDGKPLPNEKELITVLMNKPEGYVCSRNGQGSHTVYELLPSNLRYLNIVGRLDKDSGGLLIFTNDGVLHNDLTHPSKQKEKTYEVTLNKEIADPDLKILISTGVELKDGLSKFIVRRNTKSPTTYTIILKEGRNRQIRRTFNALGYKITLLRRRAIAGYSIENLKIGEFKII
jgi:pseudouridine synthase